MKLIQKVEIHNWIIEVDIEATKKQYNNDWELCQCLDCLNFYEGMKSLSNVELDFFNSFGINPTKCVQLSELGTNNKGLQLYSGCYHIVGKIIKGKPVNSHSWNDENVVEIGHFTFAFSNDLQFVPAAFPRPALQIDFETETPWVLKES